MRITVDRDSVATGDDTDRHDHVLEVIHVGTQRAEQLGDNRLRRSAGPAGSRPGDR